MVGQNKPAEPYCLDPRYSTTQLMVNSPPMVHQEPASKFQFLLQLPEGEGRQGIGGLRINGLYKCALSEKPLITVITVVFNGVSTIEDTIQSVINQTYNNVEYIVIDGGSTDGTQGVIRKYEHAIDYWVSEKDKGIYDAMNKAIALASGDYVGLLNADDLFAANNILQIVAEQFRLSKVDAIFSCLDIVDKNNLNKILRKYRITEFNSSLLRIGVMPPHPTFYCKRYCYEQAGMYKTEYKIAADFEMLARMLLRQNISWKFIDQVTVIMRAGGMSSSGFMARLRLNWEIIRACKENGLYTNWLLLALKLPIRLLELVR